MFSFSVVSHNQLDLVLSLIASIEKLVKNYEIIVTNNTKQDISKISKRKNIKIIQNISVKGFGENHNYAFKHSSGEYFVIINPDIVITKWSEKLNINANIICTSLVIDEYGRKADNVRGYPSIPNLIVRFLRLKMEYRSLWFAGMFLILKKEDYKILNGFDERYFMYLEDTDLCLRAKYMGFKFLEDNRIEVIHDCRRDSRKKIKYFIIHLKSLLYFFWKHPKTILSINP